MVSKKIILAGIAVLVLVGAGVAVAATSANASVNANDASPAAPRGLASFHEKDGAVTGRNVGFSVDGQSGAISGYASRGAWSDAVIFERISFASVNASSLKERTRGPLFVERDSPDFSLVAFDARNAAFLVTSAQGNVVTLQVPAGVNVTTYAAQPGWSPAGALLQNGDHTAKIVLHGNASIVYDGAGTITVTLGPHAHLSFRIVGFPGEWTKERRWAHEAAARRKASIAP